MKKIIAMALVVVLMVGLTACYNYKTTTNNFRDKSEWWRED